MWPDFLNITVVTNTATDENVSSCSNLLQNLVHTWHHTTAACGSTSDARLLLSPCLLDCNGNVSAFICNIELFIEQKDSVTDIV